MFFLKTLQYACNLGSDRASKFVDTFGIHKVHGGMKLGTTSLDYYHGNVRCIGWWSMYYCGRVACNDQVICEEITIHWVASKQFDIHLVNAHCTR